MIQLKSEARVSRSEKLRITAADEGKGGVEIPAVLRKHRMYADTVAFLKESGIRAKSASGAKYIRNSVLMYIFQEDKFDAFLTALKACDCTPQEKETFIKRKEDAIKDWQNSDMSGIDEMVTKLKSQISQIKSA
jgi:hypothetical protein